MTVLLWTAAALTASARTVLLERIWQYKPIICWSDGLEGDLSGNCANIVYTLVWSETLFQSTCGIPLQPFFPPPTCSGLYLQKTSPCTLAFMGVGAVGGLVLGRHLAQCILWLSTSVLEGKTSSHSRGVSLWSCASFFPSSIHFSSLFILETAWDRHWFLQHIHTASGTVNWPSLWTSKNCWTTKSPDMTTRGEKPWGQCMERGTMGGRAPSRVSEKNDLPWQVHWEQQGGDNVFWGGCT